MIISSNEKNNNSSVSRIKPMFIFKKRFLLFLIFLALLTGCYFASKTVQSKGYSGLLDFIKTISSNYWNGRNAKPENISIAIKDKDFKFLEKNRNTALERGVIINDIDGDYVPGTLEYKGKKIKIKLRLKGHMTDHLQDNKWSFRIKVKDKDSFMGMKRFSIQHPGTRGYIYEWIYHELMKREDIIALRYKFINVTLNGRDWGVYALEENFDEELIENNKRPKGPIIRFNPDNYWIERNSVMNGLTRTEEFASYYSANVEAYREDKILSDSIQAKYYLKALALVEGLRDRKLSLEQVFDVQRLAKFHAIIDLVGGQHSIDWSDIKYYYNPVTAKLEPVSYESFTDFPVRELSGMYKYVKIDSNEYYPDWHTALFSDPVFFKAYINELERVTEPKFLDSFFSEIKDELKENLSILYKEFPYKKFDENSYYKNQQMINLMLNSSKSFHAYFENQADQKLHIKIGAIDALPIEVESLTLGNEVIKPSNPIFIPCKLANQPVKYSDVTFELPADLIWNDSLVPGIIINYSILGSSRKHEQKVFPFPHTDNEFISKDLNNKISNIDHFRFLVVEEKTKSIFIKPGKQFISEDLIIPAGYHLIAEEGVSLDIKNHAKIISYSAISFIGSEDDPIIVESSDSTSNGIEIINAKISRFKYVVFKKLPKVNDEQWKRSGALTFYESPVEFKNCSFYNSKALKAINLIRSNFSFAECLFQNMNNDALDLDYSSGNINNCVFENCNNNSIIITMGNVNIKSLYINGVGNKGLNIKSGSVVNGEDVRIKQAKVALVAEDLANVGIKNMSITASGLGIVAFKNKKNAGNPKIKITGLVLVKVEKNYLKEKGCSVNVNGVEINEEVTDAEVILESEKNKN